MATGNIDSVYSVILMIDNRMEDNTSQEPLNASITTQKHIPLYGLPGVTFYIIHIEGLVCLSLSIVASIAVFASVWHRSRTRRDARQPILPRSVDSNVLLNPFHAFVTLSQTTQLKVEYYNSKCLVVILPPTCLIQQLRSYIT